MDHIKTMSDPVVLAEESRRFAMDAGRRISGCIRIELSGGKGLTAVSVDNIRFFPRGEYVYKLLFAGSVQDKQHYHIAGNISLSAYGRGEASFCINAADLDGTGTGLSDLSTVLVAAMSTVNPDEALHPVLKGMLPSSSEGPSESSSTATDDIMTASKEKHDDTATSHSQGNTAMPYGGHSTQETAQPVSGDTPRQVYRQRQNTHTVPPGQVNIPTGAGEPVRSPRAEAFYNRHSQFAVTGSNADAKTADSGTYIPTPDNAAPGRPADRLILPKPPGQTRLRRQNTPRYLRDSQPQACRRIQPRGTHGPTDLQKAVRHLTETTARSIPAAYWKSAQASQETAAPVRI